MNDIHAIRNKLGLTQIQLAWYLGISRSSLNMFERNQRPIPTPVLLKLAELQIHLIKTNSDPGEIKDHKILPGYHAQKKQTTAPKGIIHNKYHIKLDSLSLKLTEMKEQYKNLEMIRATLERLLKDHSDKDPNYTYWEMQLQHVLLKLETCDADAQDKLNRKITAITKDAAF